MVTRVLPSAEVDICHEGQRLGIEALALQEEDVLDFAHRKGRVGFVDSGSALTQVGQPVLILICERTQRHGAHLAENHGVGDNTTEPYVLGPATGGGQDGWGR